MEYPSGHLFFIGTYTKAGSRGIHAARLDGASGALSAPQLAAETGSPTFLAFGPGKKVLYAVRNSPGMLAAFSVDASGGRLTPLAPPDAAEAIPPCHVVVDRTGRAALAPNYHTGAVAALPILPDGTLGAPNVIVHRGHGTDPERQATAHPHSCTVSSDNRFALVCDLGLDRIFTYRIDLDRAALEVVDPPFVSVAPGSGPRHFTFGPDGRRAYVINELASTIVVHDYDAARGSLAPRQTISTLPADFTGKSTAAEVQFHPNGKFLYGSNRGHDSIACFSVDPAAGTLTPVETVPCGGRGPRHFVFSPDRKWLVCAHQDSNTLCSFRVDPDTGHLTPTGSTISVSMPVCVLFHD